jgi:hypothetical protein
VLRLAFELCAACPVREHGETATDPRPHDRGGHT